MTKLYKIEYQNCLFDPISLGYISKLIILFEVNYFLACPKFIEKMGR